MAAHSADATPAPDPCGLEQKPPLVTSQMLAGPRDQILDAQAENDRQRLLVHNPDPEANSVTEHLELALQGKIAPATALARTTPLLREILESNLRERGHQHAAVGPLDRLSALLHTEGIRTTLTIKAAAERLREPLKTIRRARTEQVPTRDFFLASGLIKDVIGELPVTTLRGSSLRIQLGGGLHEVLCDLLTDGAGDGTRG